MRYRKRYSSRSRRRGYRTSSRRRKTMRRSVRPMRIGYRF